jgi:site-specific DNA recombinase
VRTVLYARFSSHLQNSRSIEDQVALLRERCVREGWEIVGEFNDYAISGAAGIDEAGRPGLNAMLARVEQGGVDQVLAEATDRIARHQGDAFAIRERVTFAGARIFTLSDGEVSDITATFRGLMDAQFRKDLAAKVKRGQRGTLAQKRHPAGIAYGYRKANRIDDKGELIRGLRAIDDDQAEIVRRIFREYAAGMSPRAIAQALNDDHVPAAQPRSGAASYWRASTIYGDAKRQNGILQNRLYIGQLVLGRTRKILDPRTRKHLILPNPESEWQIEGVPELRIVDDAAWQAAQAILKRGQGQRSDQSRRPKHLLSGLARCGTCGAAWTIRGPNRWGCSRNKEGGSTACANGRTISTAIMETRVLDGLRQHMLDPRYVEVYVREYHRDYAQRARQLDSDGDRLRQRLREVEGRMARLVQAVAEGGNEFAEIRDVLAAARTDRDRVQHELDQLEQLPVVALHPQIGNRYRERMEQLAAALAANPEARLEAIPQIRSLIETIVITPAEDGRGVTIDMTGELAGIIALATGKPLPIEMYGNVGAGEGNRALPQFLKAAV